MKGQSRLKAKEGLVLSILTQADTGLAEKKLMEIFKFNILPLEVVERREAFKKTIHNCPHCETLLEFHVEKDEEQTLIQEDGHCPKCGFQVRSELHPIQ